MDRYSYRNACLTSWWSYKISGLLLGLGLLSGFSCLLMLFEEVKMSVELGGVGCMILTLLYIYIKLLNIYIDNILYNISI
jgi:hypothetical protein